MTGIFQGSHSVFMLSTLVGATLPRPLDLGLMPAGLLRHLAKRLVKKLLTLRPTPTAPSRALPHAVFAGGAAA